MFHGTRFPLCISIPYAFNSETQTAFTLPLFYLRHQRTTRMCILKWILDKRRVFLTNILEF